MKLSYNQTDLPIIYTMHLRSAYLYKWDVGPYTHWLQRDGEGLTEEEEDTEEGMI